MTRTIAWRIFFAFSLVLLVVLGLGLWGLQATRRLHELNQTLLTQAIPAVRLQLALAAHIPALLRHEARAIVLRDPAYQALHRTRTQEFRSDLHRLLEFLDGREARAALERVQARFTEYAGLVEQEWAALRRGLPDEALRLSEGPTRQAVDALEAAIATVLTQSRAELERKVGAAGGLEQWARAATVLSLAMSMAVGLGLAAMVAIRIARPIRALSQATQLVARGEYDVPIMVKSRDEVGDLARAFREMAHKLRDSEAMKEEFFANISHDLRSPLASIGAAVSLLRACPPGPKQDRWLEVIQADTRKLLRLTNQIMDLSKLRSGTLALDLVQGDLRRIAESAAEEIRPVADEKGINLVVTLPDRSLPLACDEGRLQQVLSNLLSNAVKFTPKGGQIALAASEAGEEVLVSVEDTGMGIAAAQLSQIFGRYHQAHQGNGGTGLGLAIVKGFVEAHGGRVWAESRDGDGSRFHVALPREWRVG